MSSSDSSSESIKHTATAHDVAGSVKTTDSVFTTTGAHRPASQSGSVSNPLAASVSTRPHASGSAGPSATSVSINDVSEIGEHSATSMGLSGSVKSAASTHATGMHSLPSLHSSATAMNATTVFPARSSLTGFGKGAVAANASATSTTANPGSVSVCASTIGMKTTSFNYASPTVQDSASASIATAPILLPASTPSLVNTLPPWTDSIIPAHSFGGITDIAPTRTTVAPSSSLATTNLTLEQQLTTIVDDMGKSTNLGMYENDLVYFQQLFPALNFTELVTFVKDSARDFAGYMLLKGIEAFAKTINGTFPDATRHYLDIVAAGVDDIIHEFNTTIAPAQNTSSTTVAHHHRSKRMILSEQDFLSKIRLLIGAEGVLARDNKVPQLLEFLRGFSAMRNEFTLTMQRGVAAGPDAIALTNQLRQPPEMANYLRQYENEVFDLIGNQDFQALGRLAFKVNTLSYFNVFAPPRQRDMMQSLRLLVRTMIHRLEQISLGTTNPSTMTHMAYLTLFCVIWNPLRLMMRDQQLAEGICQSDVVSLTVASQLGISVSSSLNTLVNAIFLGTGYARLPALVRTILQEIASKNSISSPVSLWRSLGLKRDSHYLDKIGQKVEQFGFRVYGGEPFLTIRSMLSKMVAAFNAKATQLPAGADANVLFTISPRTSHVIFAKIQRVNNQLSLTTADSDGYLLIASADSMDQLVARAMNVLRPLAQRYGLGLTQSGQIANGRGIGHLYQPTDAEITELADLAPIPTSSLTLKQILTKPVTELEALDKAATKALAKEYINKVTSAAGLDKLKLSQKLTEQDLLPSPSSLQVTTADSLIMQMREVISVLDDALANNTPVPEAIKKLNAHIMAKTSQSLLARAKATAGEQPDPVPGPSGVAQGVSSLDDFQYSMQMMVLQDAINAIAPEVPGAALLAHPAAGAVPQSSGGQPSGGTDQGLSVGTKAGIAIGSVGGTLGSVASGAFIKRLASNGGDAAAEDVGVRIGESAAEEFVPETEVLKSLGDGLKTSVEDLMAKAPAPPHHEPGGEDWAHIRTRGKGSKGKIKEPACRRKRALAGAGMGGCAADELYEKAVKRIVAEGVVGFSAPALMAGFAETLAVGLLTPELLMIIAAAVAAGVAGWVGYEIYELVEDGKKKGGGGDSDDDSSDNDNSGHHHSSGGSGNRGTTPTSGLLTTGQPPVTGLQPATDRPGSNPGVVADNSSPVVAIASATGTQAVVSSDVHALATIVPETSTPQPLASTSVSTTAVTVTEQADITPAMASAAMDRATSEAGLLTSLAVSEGSSSHVPPDASKALLSTALWPHTAAPVLAPGLSSSASTTIEAAPRQSESTRAQALSANTTAPIGAESSLSFNTITASLSSSETASRQAVSSSIITLASSKSGSFANATEGSLSPSGTVNTQALSSSTMARISPEMSPSMNTTEASLNPSGMAGTQRLSSSTTELFSPELGSSMNTTDVSLTPSGMAGTQTLSSSTTAAFSPELSSSMNTTDVSVTPSGMAGTQRLSSSATAAFSPELSSSMNTTDVSVTPSGMASTQTLSSNTTAPFSPELSSSMNTTDVSMTPSGMASTQTLSSNTTAPFSPELSSSMNTTDVSMTPSGMASTQALSSNTTASFSPELSSSMNTTDVSMTPSGMASTQALSSNTTAAFSPELSSTMNTTDVSMTPSGMASTQALSSNTTAPFSPELSSSMNTTDVSVTPSGMASTQALSSNTTAQFPPELSSSMNTTDVSMTPSGMASTQALSSNTTAPFSPELSSSVNTTDVSMTPSGMASTQALSSNTTAPFSPELSSSIDATGASEDLSEITKEPSTSLKTALSAAQNTSGATRPSPSAADDAETDTARAVSSSQPSTSQPTTSQPTTSQPTTSQPTTAQPSTSQPSTSPLPTSTSQTPTAHLEATPSEATPSAINDRTDAESSSPTIVPDKTTQPVATPTASVTDSHPPQVGPQGKKLLKLYADRGQAIHDRYMWQINDFQNNNVRALQAIWDFGEEITINDRIYLKWPLERLVCCAHGLRAMDKLLRDNFLSISSLAQQCISYDASRGLTMNPQAPGENPAREIIVDNLANRFLTMYSRLAQARSQMILATGFAMAETGEAGLFRGFNAQGMDNMVNALLRDASGVSAPFREVLEGVADYLDRQITEERLNDGNVLRTPGPDEQLMSVIHNATVADHEFTLPSGWLEPGDLVATNRIIRGEQARFLANMGVYRDWNRFPVDYRKIFQNPTDYDAVFPNDDTVPCHYSESGLDDTSALAPLLSRPPATSQFTVTERKLLKGYVGQATAIYADYAHQAEAIKHQNREIMAAIPAEESDSITWPEKRQVCCVNLLETLERQFRDSFLNMTSTAGQYLRYEEQSPNDTADHRSTEVSIIKNLANQFLNLYGLYSAARYDMVKATGFGGEAAADDRFRGYNAAAVAGAVTGLLARSARMSAPIRKVLRTLENALAHDDHRYSANDRRPPQPDTALQRTVENVRVADDEFNLSPPMLDARDVKVINRIIRAERKDYFLNTRPLRDERFVMFGDVFDNTADLQNQLSGEQLPCPTSEQGLADTSALSELLERAADQAPRITAEGKKLLKLYADGATQSYRAYSQRISNIQSANTRAVQDIKENDNTLSHNGLEYQQWSLARLVCCAQGLQTMDRAIMNTFQWDLIRADRCIRYDASRGLTIGPDASGENPTREAMIDDLVNQFLNMYSQYGEARFNMIKATGFSLEEAAESPVFRGFSARGMATTINDLLRTTSGLSAPLRDVLRGVANYLDNRITGDHHDGNNDLRPPQTDRHLLQIINDTTVVDDEFILPPVIMVRGDIDAIKQLVQAEKVDYLARLGELEDREHFPTDFIDIFEQPDAYAEVFLKGEVPQCHGDSRKRRQLDSHRSGKPVAPPRDEPAIANDHPATAGAARHGGLLSALRGGLSWLTGRATANQPEEAAPEVTAGQSHHRQESANGADDRVASRVRPVAHSVNDSLALAGLLVSRATDRPIRPDQTTLAHGEMPRTDTAAQPFDCLPGMQLLTGSMRVARQLRSEVSAFLQQLNQQKIQPDAGWQADDLLNMAIAVVSNESQPTNCTEEFLHEVLFSPRLGIEHERAANIFDSDGRVRGTDGGAIFFGTEQTKPSQSGPARDLGQCMLSAMADRQLEQLTTAPQSANSGPLLSAALRDAIVDRASQFQELQRKGMSAQHSRGVFSQLPNWLSASSGNDSSRREQLLQRLEQRLTPVTSSGVVRAGDTCLSQLEAGDYGSARASFFALSDQQQQQAIQSLTTMPDCFGLEPRWDDPAPRDSQSAWQRFTALYDSKMGVQEEAMNRLKLMSMVSAGKVTRQYDEAQQLVAHIVDLLPTRDNASQRSCQEAAECTQPEECAQPPVFQQHQYDQGTITDMLSAYKTIKAEVAEQLPQYFINHTLDSDLQEEIITQVALGSLGSLNGKAVPAGQREAEIAARLQTEVEEFVQTAV